MMHYFEHDYRKMKIMCALISKACVYIIDMHLIQQKTNNMSLLPIYLIWSMYEGTFVTDAMEVYALHGIP